jgi:Tol biopolymer transport system component
MVPELRVAHRISPAAAPRRAARTRTVTIAAMARRRVAAIWAILALVTGASGCRPSPSTDAPNDSASAISSPAPSPASSQPPTATPLPSRTIGRSQTPVLVGEPIDISTLSGRIVFDDFEDVYAMNVDGSDVVTVAADTAGPEFDGAWSPDGAWIVYRDSTRGINEDDEIYIAAADGSERRNLTANPANDWGPDWSPDGTTIAFNSDRDAPPLGGYLVNPDGSNLRAIDAGGWFEYPSFSPDGTRIAFMGARGADYDIYVIDLATEAVTRLTSARGAEGWPSWSPDGATIAFTSVRDDCSYAPVDQDCWQTGDIGPHHDIWLINADGTNERRVTPEFGQFVTWSPDSQYLLISGYALYVIRPDGSGRQELRAEGISRSIGGIPDWVQGVMGAG